jgi:hypothetical protein
VSKLLPKPLGWCGNGKGKNYGYQSNPLVRDSRGIFATQKLGRAAAPADRFTIDRINVGGYIYNRTMRDEQAEEIIEALKDYYENPEAYTIADLEDIFQDRDPFEFL